MRRITLPLAALAACAACARVVAHLPNAPTASPAASASGDLAPPPGKTDTPDQAAGERLFLETRFAQFFFQSLPATPAPSDYNASLLRGDPVVATSVSVFEDFPGPFAGKSINCRSCHLVDDLQQMPAPNGRNYSDYFTAGVRNYSDFARRSPIPSRTDGATVTPRNSPTLVSATVPRTTPFFLHFDGEFATSADLIRATYTGRNFGWLPAEASTAVAHFAAVIRNDDGAGDLAATFSAGLPYSVILAGTDPRIPRSALIDPRYRIDVNDPAVSDSAVLDAAVQLVVAYLDSLRFKTDP